MVNDSFGKWRHSFTRVCLHTRVCLVTVSLSSTSTMTANLGKYTGSYAVRLPFWKTTFFVNDVLENDSIVLENFTCF